MGIYINRICLDLIKKLVLLDLDQGSIAKYVFEWCLSFEGQKAVLSCFQENIILC